MLIEDGFDPVSLQNSPGANAIQDENLGYISVEITPLRFISHGKFRGFQDTRGLRCINKSCQVKGRALCGYCKVLPYVSSNLRCMTRSSLPEISIRLPVEYSFIKQDSLDNRLGNLLEELQKIQDDSEGAIKNGTSMKSWPSLSTLPLLRARERLSRIKHRIWTKEDLTHLESFFLKRSTKSLNRGLFTSKRPTSSSSYSGI